MPPFVTGLLRRWDWGGGGRIQVLGVLLLVRFALAKAGPKALCFGLCFGLGSWAGSGQGLGVVIFSKL